MRSFWELGLSSLDTEPACASGPYRVQQGLAPQWSLALSQLTLPVVGDSQPNNHWSSSERVRMAFQPWAQRLIPSEHNKYLLNEQMRH